MAKNKSRKHIFPKQATRPTIAQADHQQQKSHTWRSQLWKTAKWIVVFVVGLVGFLAAIYQFFPLLSITASSALNPNNPFSVPFTITNEGYLNLYDLEVSCRVNANYSRDDRIIESLFRRIGDTARILKPREQLTAICTANPAVVFPGTVLLSADIAMHVSYQTEFLWWRKDQAFRFITTHSSDGLLRWLPQPMEK